MIRWGYIYISSFSDLFILDILLYSYIPTGIQDNVHLQPDWLIV